jgi:DNA-directed RNA polymerase specialized sigma24 family protein
LGDQASWREFFDAYWRLIHATALKAGLTDTEAEEVVQEVMIAAAKKMPEFTYEPSQRYPSAGSMLAELESLQVGQSVKRRRARQRTWRYAKKVALVVSTLATVSGIAYWLSDWRSHSSGSTRSGQLDFTWSTNAQANEEFRNGMRSLVSLHSLNNSLQAIQHLQRAVELDPNFADAWAQLAGAWNSAAGTTNQQANVLMAAEKAVSLNTNSALAYSMLASAKDQSLDWAGAEEA